MIVSDGPDSLFTDEWLEVFELTGKSRQEFERLAECNGFRLREAYMALKEEQAWGCVERGLKEWP
jgi:hypothetical protein